MNELPEVLFCRWLHGRLTRQLYPRTCGASTPHRSSKAWPLCCKSTHSRIRPRPCVQSSTRSPRSSASRSPAGEKIREDQGPIGCVVTSVTAQPNSQRKSFKTRPSGRVPAAQATIQPASRASNKFSFCGMKVCLLGARGRVGSVRKLPKVFLHGPCPAARVAWACCYSSSRILAQGQFPQRRSGSF